MTRTFLAVALVMTGLAGCSSSAQVVSKDVPTGTVVISVPDNTNVWPFYNRRAALALAEKEVGPNPAIVSEQLVNVGTRTNNSQNVNGQSVTGVTTTSEVTQFQITFQKSTTQQRPPMYGPGNVQQTQFRPGSGGTGMQPAGGIVPSVQPVAGNGLMPWGG